MSWNNFKDPSYGGGFSGTPYPEIVKYVLDDQDYRDVRIPEAGNGSLLVLENGDAEENLGSIRETLSEEIGSRHPSEFILQRIGGGRETGVYEVLWR